MGQIVATDMQRAETIEGGSTVPDMQAVVCHGPKDYRLQRIKRPVAGRNELVIKIAACGICASDCKCHSGAAMFWGGEGQPSWVKPPVVPGHEFSAT